MFRGLEYLNCDHFTEEQMAAIADWENAPSDVKQTIVEENGWQDEGLFEGLFTRKRDEQSRA